MQPARDRLNRDTGPCAGTGGRRTAFEVTGGLTGPLGVREEVVQAALQRRLTVIVSGGVIFGKRIGRISFKEGSGRNVYLVGAAGPSSPRVPICHFSWAVPHPAACA